MIVRILNEGQYKLRGDYLVRLDELDHRLTGAIASGDDTQFREAFAEMLDTVRSGGQRLPDGALAESDLVLPAPDATMKDVQLLFTDNITG